MRLPGFAAESTLYRTKAHYKMAVGDVRDSPNTGFPGQPAAVTLSSQVVPGVVGPFPNVLCEPCALDQSGECTRYCVHCPTPYPSEECWSSFTPCDDSECCQAGQNPCYVPGKSQFCCPSGQSCCDPATNFCCPNPGESCCNPATKFCCPSQQTPCCSAETNLCCAPGELCCDPGNLCCPAGNICCGGGCCPHQCCGGDTCTNLETDPLNCGLCTLVCPEPANSTSTCVNGKCGLACDSGYTQCGNACCPSADGCCSGSCTPLNTTSNCGACGISCGPGSCCWNGVCLSSVPPANGGYWNWPLYSADCQNIQGLTVQLSVDDAFVPTPASNGFSLQLNGYAPLGSGEPCYGIDWLQYILYVKNGQAWAQIQYWNNEICENFGSSPCTWPTLGLASECGTNPNNPWLPLGDNLFFQQLSPNNVPSTDIIPSNSLLKIALTTNTAGQVTEALFTITIDGVTSSASYPFPSHQLYGFSAFVPVVVASPSSTVNFSSGSGQLSSSVSIGELCAELEGSPGSICGVTWASGTGESSNAVYGPISACCGSTLQQSVTT
jgi:hypothetical protein